MRAPSNVSEPSVSGAGATGYHVWHPFTQMGRFDREPQLVIESARGNVLVAEDGREYIDAIASMWAIVHGHGHPAIVEAIREQASKLQHSTLLGVTHRPAIELAERLAALLPGDLDHVFFSENGASAVDVALKVAVQYWTNVGRSERSRIVSMEGAYHGDTIGAVSVGGDGPFRDVYAHLLFEPLRFPSPYHYRCEHCAGQDTCSCVEQLDDVLAEHGEQVAAVIIEPRVQGAGGMIIAPEGHITRVRRLCDEYDVLLIADEVATGFGKTGAMFACDLEGVVPDLMVLGKGITGGYLPLSATVASGRIYDAFYDPRDEARKLFHGHTYAGNPICCAAALANIDLLEREGVLPRVRVRADFLAAQLAERLGDHPHVGEIRQQGLMVGVELVQHRDTKRPFPSADATGWQVCLAARDEGVSVRPLGDTIVIMPPLSIEEAELERISGAVSHGLDAVTAVRSAR